MGLFKPAWQSNNPKHIPKALAAIEREKSEDTLYEIACKDVAVVNRDVGLDVVEIDRRCKSAEGRADGRHNGCEYLFHGRIILFCLWVRRILAQFAQPVKMLILAKTAK